MLRVVPVRYMRKNVATIEMGIETPMISVVRGSFRNSSRTMMAALVRYCEDGNDHDNDPLQFRLPYLDRDLDVGFFSRKRPINTESSFSVLG